MKKQLTPKQITDKTIDDFMGKFIERNKDWFYLVMLQKEAEEKKLKEGEAL